MAMFDNIFAGQNGLAVMLLKTMGVSGCKYLHKESSYDPRTDKTEETITEKTVTLSPPLKYSAYQIANLGVGKQDCKIIGDGVSFQNVQNSVDQVIVNGDTYTILDHKKLWSGAKIAAVILQVRKQGAVYD